MNLKKILNLNFLISFFIIQICIFHVGLPLYVDITISILLTFIFRNILVSTITMTIFICLFIFTNLIYDAQIDYRAHEMLSTKNNHYLPNQNIKIVQPFGDLFAIGEQNKNLQEIVEPRKIQFVTDKKGFRNQKINNNNAYLLIGDSFIVGNGTTQTEILSEQMSDRLNKPIYNLSYPGDPMMYEHNLNNNLHLLSEKKNILLFYFEGNDFERVEEKSEIIINSRNFFTEIILKLEELKTNYLNMIYPRNFKFVRIINRKTLPSYVYIKNFITGKTKAYESFEKISVKKIGNSKVGFLKDYNEITSAKSLKTYVWKDKELLKKIKYVIFIPTKYRVYNKVEKNIPLKVLKKGYESKSIKVIDLTNILQEAANYQIKKNKYVFWRDDTHWNGLGISAVADHLVKQLK